LLLWTPYVSYGVQRYDIYDFIHVYFPFLEKASSMEKDEDMSEQDVTVTIHDEELKRGNILSRL
jgi:hypothetical protein